MSNGHAFSRDISPLIRILDFQLFRQEEKDLQLELVWTTLGGDFDHGRGESGTKNDCFVLKPGQDYISMLGPLLSKHDIPPNTFISVQPISTK